MADPRRAGVGGGAGGGGGGKVLHIFDPPLAKGKAGSEAPMASGGASGSSSSGGSASTR